MVAFLYLVQHMAAPLLVFGRGGRFLYVIGSLISFGVIYFFKPDTYDIDAYVKAVSYPFIFEPAYAFLNVTLKAFTSDPRKVVWIIQLLIAAGFLWVSLRVSAWNKIALVGVICLFSVPFSLGVNNGLRQAASSVFLVAMMVCLFEKRFFKVFLLFLISVAFHYSAALIGSVLFAVFGVFGIFYSGKVGEIFRQMSPLTLGVTIALSALVAALGIQYLMDLGFYSGYSGKQFEAKTPLWVKVIPIFGLFLASETLLKERYRYDFFSYIRLSRLFFIFFVLFLAPIPEFDEAGSRVLYFYFVLDLVFQILCLQYRKLMSLIILLVGNGLAFNVWNVLGGLKVNVL